MINEEIGFKYWDQFRERINETVSSLKEGKLPRIRRIAIHLTNRCNLNCSYCNEKFSNKELSFELFRKITREFSLLGGGVVHVTGGEPTTVSYFSDLVRFINTFDNIYFHLNTNSIKRLTENEYKSIKRLKVSLDSYNEEYFDSLVSSVGAFKKVKDNLKFINDIIKEGTPCVSITYTVTKENYKEIPDFLKMYYKEFPNFYATFFSCYKGDKERFIMSDEDVKYLFDKIVPQIYEIAEENNDKETKFLFNYSHDLETFNSSTDRFPGNKTIPCYISLSELLINENGDIWNCSHLFRDKVSPTGQNIKNTNLKDVVKTMPSGLINGKCLYGCNKKLQAFNKEVLRQL